MFKPLNQLRIDRQKKLDALSQRYYLFFNNPYMINEVKKLRIKYDIPEDGFNDCNESSAQSYGEWFQQMHTKYQNRWEQMPEDIAKAQEEWEKFTPEEQEIFDEPVEWWDRDFILNVKEFQDELRALFSCYSHKLKYYGLI